MLVEPTAAGVAEGLIAVTADDSAVDALVAAGARAAAAFTWDASVRAHARVWTSIG